ncbi:MAG TPA: hypothetical protein VGT03_16490 [Candidatus Acidoferrales bacterium]|nr:hypothetical protein [Candidatus Acidoferrales bacterium]
MTLNQLLALIRATWIAIGPLVGVLIGGYLTIWNQKRHWVMDNKRAEYRKLLSTLTRTYTTLINTHSTGVMSGREEKKCEQARLEALNVLRDRIFIAKEVKQMGISLKWSRAVGELNVPTPDYRALQKAYAEISAAIQENAAKIMT